MIFIETTLFTKLIPRYLSDDEYAGLQNYLLQYPDAGRIVRGSGGVRKVRWAAFAPHILRSIAEEIQNV